MLLSLFVACEPPSSALQLSSRCARCPGLHHTGIFKEPMSFYPYVFKNEAFYTHIQILWFDIPTENSIFSPQEQATEGIYKGIRAHSAAFCKNIFPFSIIISNANYLVFVDMATEWEQGWGAAWEVCTSFSQSSLFPICKGFFIAGNNWINVQVISNQLNPHFQVLSSSPLHWATNTEHCHSPTFLPDTEMLFVINELINQLPTERVTTLIVFISKSSWSISVSSRCSLPITAQQPWMSALPRLSLTLTCKQKVLEWHREKAQAKLVRLIFLLGQFIQYSLWIKREHHQGEFPFGCRRLSSFADPSIPTASLQHPRTVSVRPSTESLGRAHTRAG